MIKSEIAEQIVREVSEGFRKEGFILLSILSVSRYITSYRRRLTFFSLRRLPFLLFKIDYSMMQEIYFLRKTQ